MNTVYIGLGSNLESPVSQVSTAIDELARLDALHGLHASSLYRSAPLGPADQPDYINAVVGLHSELGPHDLLDRLQDIENQHGRIRAERWGPRTLDLDILLFSEQIIDDDRLKVPHPGLDQRSFVLYPLFEIAPKLLIPGYGPISELVRRCSDAGLERLSTA